MGLNGGTVATDSGLVQKDQRTTAPFFSTLHKSYIPLFFNIGSSSPSLAHLFIYCLNIFSLFIIARSVVIKSIVAKIIDFF
jgi:hypothetical protein